MCLQLHSPSFLRSKRLSELLKKLHDAKLKELTGKKLYEEILQPSIESDITPAVKSMLWSVLAARRGFDRLTCLGCKVFFLVVSFR